ncbi:MAG: hypothetical protein CMJ83_02440 [Planctomycetes bacterium]|nr:hypothetical protein [Planctomycetota bacterium]
MPRCRFVLLPGLLTLLLVTLVRSQPDQAPHPARDLRLESISWIEDGAEFLDQRRFKTRLTGEEKATDRGAILDRALEQARESGRPVLWYVYKVVESTKRGRQLIRAPVLDIYMRQVVWSDPDVERIVTASFVPVRMVCDESLCERFGLRPLKFLEPAIVVLKPDGKVAHVVANVRTFDAAWFADVLRGVLEKVQGPLETKDVGQAMDRGEWASALALLEADSDPSADILYRKALLKRRLRDADGALKLLAAADAKLRTGQGGRGRGRPRRAPSGLATRVRTRRQGDVAAERGLVFVREGRFDDAVKVLRSVFDARVGTRRAEAGYLLALIRLHAGDETGALRRFHEIIQRHPKDPFARRARVNLLLGVDDARPLGAAFFGHERLQWLPSASPVGGALPADTTWPGKLPTVSELVKRGVRHLLAQQRADGGWNDARYAYCPDKRITPNVWVAVSALALQALQRHRARVPELAEAIDDALARGDRYLMDASRINRGHNEDVYADAYRLLYLAHRHDAQGIESKRRATRRSMRSIVGDAAERQREAGFWAHEYSNAFCTAVMVQGLLAAKDRGVPIDQKVLDQAASAITAARREDGSFSYGGTAGSRRGGAKNLQNASTRTALCEAALHALGKSSPERVRASFANFWKHYDRIEGVRRTDFHSDGQIAGFMFFHTLYHTSEAVDHLDPALQAETHARLVERVRHYPEIDGLFMDSHEMGKSYGTAMALLVIANALSEER